MKLPIHVVSQFLRALYEQPEGIEYYDLHERFGWSPGQILILVETFEADRVVSHHANRAWLTPYGRRLVLRRRRELFLTSRSRPWRAPLSRYMSKAVPPDQPRIPSNSAWLQERVLLQRALTLSPDSKKARRAVTSTLR